MDQIQAAIDAATPSTRFQIFSGLLKASRSPSDGRMRLSGIASSTTRDLHGDTMQASAIEDMERSANNNLTIFLNHSYEVPEDVAGSVESAKMRTRGVDALGNPNYDLDVSILINDANERAVKTFEAIERGTKLGLSIGAMIPEGGADRQKNGTYIINHVDLLETSLVGIPANPRSWVEYAVKSLRSTEPIAPIEPTVAVAAAAALVDVTMFGDTSKTFLVQTAKHISDGVEVPCTDKCVDGTHFLEAIEPDVADAQVTIIQIDTEDGSSTSDPGPIEAATPQDGSSTNPDTGDGDHVASADGAIAITQQLTLDNGNEAIQRMLDLLTSTTRELVDARNQVTELTASVAVITSARDSATAERDLVLVETKRVLDNLANTPLMRRAVVVDAERELRSKFSGIYSDDFLKMLETPNDRAR